MWVLLRSWKWECLPHSVDAAFFFLLFVCLFAFCAPLRNIVISTAFIKALLLSLFLPLIFSGKSPCYRAVLLFSRVVSFSLFFPLHPFSLDWLQLVDRTFFFFGDEVQFFFFFYETRERRMLRQLRLRVLRQASFSFPFIHVLLMLFFFLCVCVLAFFPLFVFFYFFFFYVYSCHKKKVRSSKKQRKCACLRTARHR